ncbi:YqzE family protein [Paenibacillus sp. TAB 01]|uniref:YqzE family protein n=1 Tax=Paenibacillus sp. TAB 01 TaxID=3368988 RepID=UPI0037517C31
MTEQFVKYMETPKEVRRQVKASQREGPGTLAVPVVRDGAAGYLHVAAESAQKK